MKRAIIAIVTLLFAQQSFANCIDGNSKEMSYYAYMEESELTNDYCLCKKLYDLKTASFDTWIARGALDYAEKTLDEQKVMSGEMTKISRVLKKDYSIEEVQCDEK